MNEDTDVAKSAADIALTCPSLTGVLTAITLSKKTSNRIKFNFRGALSTTSLLSYLVLVRLSWRGFLLSLLDWANWLVFCR